MELLIVFFFIPKLTSPTYAMHNEVESSKGHFHIIPHCGQICTDMHDTDSYNEAANRLVAGVRSLDLFVLELQFRVSFVMQIECRGRSIHTTDTTVPSDNVSFTGTGSYFKTFGRMTLQRAQ